MSFENVIEKLLADADVEVITDADYRSPALPCNPMPTVKIESASEVSS